MSELAIGVRTDSARGERTQLHRRFAHNPLFEPFSELGYTGLEPWAWENYKATILSFARRATAASGRPARLLEIGGGRDPLFTPQEAHDARLDVTVNDIDASELARAPQEFARACFDIAGDLGGAGAGLGTYDLIFSQMVMEHVAGVARAWANMHALLAPGGVALAFIPTLYAPPFVINKSIPEAVSGRILRWFFPHRHEGIQPKFPALYEWCFGSDAKVAPMLNRAGFSETLVVPFWTHGYFRKVPLVREADRAVQHMALARDWRALTTYAYVLARK